MFVFAPILNVVPAKVGAAEARGIADFLHLKQNLLPKILI
jgi:hypothetical protein